MNREHLSPKQLLNISFYQTIEAIGDAWKDILQENLRLPQGAAVLDAGCGTGFLSILLAQLGYRVTALDFSSEVLLKAEENAEKYDVKDNITFLKADAAHTPLMDGTLDAVLSRNASSLFLKPFEAYYEWHRILKPGGQLLNFDANWLCPLWGDSYSREFYEDEKIVKQEFPDYTDMYHDRFVMRKLSQYPLSYLQRPDWDEGACEALRFGDITTREYPAEGVLPPILARRFRTIPMFLIKATK